MKKLSLFTLLCLAAIFTTAQAQLVDYTLYPDYSPEINPDYSLMIDGNARKGKMSKAKGARLLPDHVDNSRTIYFPPVFNQDGGSCGSASRISYMFSHELNSYRNADGQLLCNRYPSHFVWLLNYGNSWKSEFAMYIGIPSAEVYGGTTYSSLFGNQTTHDNDAGWMTGYDKWYSGMFNRMISTVNFPLDVGTEAGRDAVKRWLYNHNGDDDFHSGGIAVINSGAGGTWWAVPSSPTNDKIGATGMKYVRKWGTVINHALTIVGYDDRIEFDLNGNGILGEKEADEKGAWIIANSWGDRWCNKGFIYCPYAYGGGSFRENGTFYKNWWHPEIYKVRKNYRPLRTIKVRMDYSRRSEICLSAGISTDLNASRPEKSIQLHHFRYAGDGNKGTTNPAPEVPMLGRWADGILHTEPMEFGYDLTDLSAGFDKNGPLKYFFIIDTKDWAVGNGKIRNASIIDYEIAKNGIETPFPIDGEGVEIQNQGNRTIISTIVYGNNYLAPQNISMNGNTLSWNAPLKSLHKTSGYKIYFNDEPLDSLKQDNTSYTLDDVEYGSYSVSAIYEDGTESSRISLYSPVVLPLRNQVIDFTHCGFAIPEIFNSHYEDLTLEYWIKPHSLHNWNQSAGPRWGLFMLHASYSGYITAGWDTGDHRAETPSNMLSCNNWTHVAYVIKKNKIKIYVNGVEKASVASNQYSGIGNFGEFKFHADDEKKNSDAMYDEIRIWDYARTADEIMQNKNVEFSGNTLPKGLIAYYKGEIIKVKGKNMLAESVSGNHARIIGGNYAQTTDANLRLKTPNDGMNLEIVQPAEPVYANVPVVLSATHSNAINKLVWTAEDANVPTIQHDSPAFTFSSAGSKKVTATGYNAKGDKITGTCVLKVEATPVPDATFTMDKDSVSAGENITMLSNRPVNGYIYEWSMPGSEVTTIHNINAKARYSQKGTYNVTLKVTGPDGAVSQETKQVSVVEVVPEADFDIQPTVIVKGGTTFLKDKSKYSPNQWQWSVKSNTEEIVVNGQNSYIMPESSGIYDITLSASNGTGSNQKVRNKVLTVCNADSKNGLMFTGNESRVDLSKVPFEKDGHRVTVEWWMNPGKPVNFYNGMGEEETLEFKFNDKGAILITSGHETVESKANYIKANEWHHYAVIFNYGLFKFYRDGEFIDSQKMSLSEIPAINGFSIGLKNAPMKCHMDEFRIWNNALNEKDLKTYANAPVSDIAKAVEHKLAVYYDFNQGEGNVIDRSGNQNDGIRVNFGPDGDAWGLSKGVFCLNFNKPGKNMNVSSKYLKNYRKPFKCDGEKLVNPTEAPRFGAITGWTLENATVSNDTVTGVHVDKSKESTFSFTTGLFGFKELENHKAYQTVTLPAGNYRFSANYFINSYGDYTKSYIVVAKGKGLPDTAGLDNALLYNVMKSKSVSNCSELYFTLDEETEISLGLVINLSGNQVCSIKDFMLEKVDATIVTANNSNGYDLTVDASGYSSLCLPYPTVIPLNTSVYTVSGIQGGQLVLQPIESGIIPANTGVIVMANAGTYHFAPSAVPGTQSSILTGVLQNTEPDPDRRYFKLGTDPVPGFHLLQGDMLEANRAYLVTEADNTLESYPLELNPTGIEEIRTDVSGITGDIYDLNGFRISKPVRGNIYIINGKKVYFK